MDIHGLFVEATHSWTACLFVETTDSSHYLYTILYPSIPFVHAWARYAAFAFSCDLSSVRE